MQRVANVRIYILCFDDTSENKAHQMATTYDWARVMRIPSTKYFENVVFFETLHNVHDDWKDMDFVGTLSYSCEKKGVLLQRVDECIRSLQPEQIDVVAFLGGEYPMLPHSEYIHPGFGKVWTKMWSALHVTPHISNNIQKGFYCNYWMAKPTWLVRFMRFQCRVKTVLEEDKDIQPFVCADSGYMRYKQDINMSNIWSIFQQPFYTFHPFLLERVAPLFFKITGARVHVFDVLKYNNRTGVVLTCPEVIGALPI